MRDDDWCDPTCCMVALWREKASTRLAMAVASPPTTVVTSRVERSNGRGSMWSSIRYYCRDSLDLAQIEFSDFHNYPPKEAILVFVTVLRLIGRRLRCGRQGISKSCNFLGEACW